MDINQLFSGTMMLAIFSYIAYQLREIPIIIYKKVLTIVLYTVHVDESDVLFKYLEIWFLKYYEEKHRNVRARFEDDSIIVQHFQDTFLIKYQGKNVLVKKEREKFENAGSFYSAFFNNYTIQGINAKSQILLMLNEAVRYAKSIEKKDQHIYINGGSSGWKFVGRVVGKSMDAVILKDKQKLLDDVDKFIRSENWYSVRGLNYRRTYCLQGSPGNGKTSFAIALSKRLNRDIYFLNLGDISKDATLFSIYQELPHNCILVMEDIDRVLDKNKKVSVSALLNCMDGALSKHGLITILTTNHPDRIDPAILREGRVDMTIDVSNPAMQQVEEYLSLFYDKPIKLGEYNHNYSMAKIQEVCLSNDHLYVATLLTMSKQGVNGYHKKISV